jgi:dynein heavy chain
LNKDVTNVETLGLVMLELKKIRAKESEMEMEIDPVLEMYNILENYLPFGFSIISKDEMDTKSVLNRKWSQLCQSAGIKQDELQAMQGKYKKTLITDVKQFIDDVKHFRID